MYFPLRSRERVKKKKGKTFFNFPLRKVKGFENKEWATLNFIRLITIVNEKRKVNTILNVTNDRSNNEILTFRSKLFNSFFVSRYFFLTNH